MKNICITIFLCLLICGCAVLQSINSPSAMKEDNCGGGYACKIDSFAIEKSYLLYSNNYSGSFMGINNIKSNTLKNQNSTNEARYPRSLSTATEVYAKNVSAHIYQLLVKIGVEPKGYGLYTYVLFGKRLFADDKLSNESKYSILLRVVQQYQNTEIAKIDKAQKDKMNIFVIPAIRSTGTIDSSGYNYNLSMQIIEDFKKKYLNTENKNIIFNNEGPYLVTVIKPLFDFNKVIYLIYLDLSEMNENGVEQVVTDYIKRLESQDFGNRSLSDFEDFRIQVLDVLLDMNESLKVIKIAVAGS